MEFVLTGHRELGEAERLQNPFKAERDRIPLTG